MKDILKTGSKALVEAFNQKESYSKLTEIYRDYTSRLEESSDNKKEVGTAKSELTAKYNKLVKLL